jgi:hypothetical protein
MVTWAAYRDQIRRSVLNDTENATWTDEQLHDCMVWGIHTFCAHTALPKELTIAAGSLNAQGDPYDLANDLIFDLPDDLYDNFDVTGAASILKPSGERIKFDPATRTRGMSPDRQSTPGFFVYMNQLRLSEVVGEENELVLRYFAYYPTPELADVETTDLTIPRWAEKPVATLVGSYALEWVSVQSANIDRWKDKTDSGNPEHNALRKQAEYMMTQYERMLLKYPPQDRENFYRELDPWDIRVWK